LIKADGTIERTTSIHSEISLILWLSQLWVLQVVEEVSLHQDSKDISTLLLSQTSMTTPWPPSSDQSSNGTSEQETSLQMSLDSSKKSLQAQ
jgi:hypothetical protein